MAELGWVELLVTGLGSAGAGAGVTGLFSRRKTVAEADKTDVEATQALVDTAMRLIAPLNDKITQLTIETEKLSQRVQFLEEENACLREQLSHMEDDGR